jgi:hypothetical protein
MQTTVSFVKVSTSTVSSPTVHFPTSLVGHLSAIACRSLNHPVSTDVVSDARYRLRVFSGAEWNASVMPRESQTQIHDSIDSLRLYALFQCISRPKMGRGTLRVSADISALCRLCVT